MNWVGTAIAGVQYELQENSGAGFTTIYTGAAPRFDLINKPSGSYTYQVRAVPTLASGFTTSAYRAGVNAAVVTRTIITSPAANSNVVQGTPILITVSIPTAPAGSTVKRVDYLSNGALIGTSTTAPAYSFSWTPAAGIATQNLSAITYYSNNVTSSSAVVPLVLISSAPTITLDTPVNGSAFNLVSPIPLAATPSAVVGSFIFIVEFYDGATLIGYDFTSPYSFSYNPTSAGAHSLTAKAYYSNGAVATSAANVVTVFLGAPASILVPSTSSTGNYTVSWASSGGTGITYTLEESIDNFATYPANTITVTSGTSATSATVLGKKDGTYYYRVQAAKIGSPASAWTTGATGIVVTLQAATPSWLSVPANTNAVGAVYLIAASSTTPGATYNFEYSSNGGTSWTPTTVANPLLTNPTITLPAPGTYLFRVYVTATGYAASGYTTGTGPCVYSNVATAPGFLSIPANANANGTVYIIAGSSATPGATYNFEYSANGGTSWTPVTVANPLATNPTITLPSPGTYLFRAYVTATGYTASGYTAGTGPCVYSALIAAPTYLATPAVSNANGTVSMIAAASATPGATYNFEYSANGGTSWTPATVANPLATNPTITLPAPGTYLFRVYVTATGYTASGYTAGTGPCVFSALIAAPAYLSTPAVANTNGTVYMIAAASATPGATYNFEYSANGGTSWTPATVANPLATNPTITLPAPGTYLFRVYVTATGYTASGYTGGIGPCIYSAVATASASLSVPLNVSSAGTAYLIAGGSPTPGALYNFQYRIVGSGVWIDGALSQTITNPTITLPGPGTYEFQTWVTAPGFTASSFRPGGNSCTVSSVAVSPPWFSVPVSTASSNIYVVAGASTTPGISYLFEYSTAGIGGPWTPIGAIGIRNQTLTLPTASGATYTLRATAVDPTLPTPVYSPSLPKLGSNTIIW